jgi:Cupin domain
MTRSEAPAIWSPPAVRPAANRLGVSMLEVLAGVMRARIGDTETRATAGESLEVAAGTAHRMWNDGEQVAVMRWVTVPAGRTLDWFRELAAVQRSEPLGDPETLLARYADVFRLAAD